MGPRARCAAATPNDRFTRDALWEKGRSDRYASPPVTTTLPNGARIQIVPPAPTPTRSGPSCLNGRSRPAINRRATIGINF